MGSVLRVNQRIGHTHGFRDRENRSVKNYVLMAMANIEIVRVADIPNGSGR